MEMDRDKIFIRLWKYQNKTVILVMSLDIIAFSGGWKFNTFFWLPAIDYRICICISNSALSRTLMYGDVFISLFTGNHVSIMQYLILWLATYNIPKEWTDSKLLGVEGDVNFKPADQPSARTLWTQRSETLCLVSWVSFSSEYLTLVIIFPVAGCGRFCMVSSTMAI